MPALNRTAESPLARRREHVEYPHEDERDRLARGCDLALDTSARCTGGENTRGPNFSKISGSGDFA